MPNIKKRYHQMPLFQQLWYNKIYDDYKEVNLDESHIDSWLIQNPKNSLAEEYQFIQFITGAKQQYLTFKINPFRFIIDRPTLLGFKFNYVCYARDKNKISYENSCDICHEKTYNGNFDKRNLTLKCNNCTKSINTYYNSKIKKYLHGYCQHLLKQIILNKYTL